MSNTVTRKHSSDSNAVSCASVALTVLELFDKGVTASSRLLTRLPAFPMTSKGRVAALLICLDVLKLRMFSDLKLVERFSFCEGPPWSRVAA